MIEMGGDVTIVTWVGWISLFISFLLVIDIVQMVMRK